ncbi:ankyrin repeat and LEM domain-containing protein 2 [Trichonephila inaurata madagascariensis]|uniref:Ankyrin repeat and LEM domain-containing protein 2 n=1 Tax=Trichonephila inaurata madagascariensis TaxID=2747483 RepID=A0A8X6IHQ7_9ARAC|nr:ankyrin repeat and LEM domain-containing protein 2 [Trichonephila inaurata madagascariensis]
MGESFQDLVLHQTDKDVFGLTELFSRLSLSDSPKNNCSDNSGRTLVNSNSHMTKFYSWKKAKNNCVEKQNQNDAGVKDLCLVMNDIKIKEKISCSEDTHKKDVCENDPSLETGDATIEKKQDPEERTVGMKYYAVALPVGLELSGEGTLIYTELKDALKAIKTYKGARFKEFATKESALEYTFEPLEKVEKKKPIENEHLRYCSSQELCKLRKMIERGDEVNFSKQVWTYPRALIGEVDIPTVLQHGVRFNALHVAAKCDKPLICQLILDILENPKFSEILYPEESPSMRARRMFYVRDLYLNTGTQKTGDTPLHYASKFGSIDCCKVLLSHPQCDPEKTNVDGLTPKETICDRLNTIPCELRTQIETIFEEGLIYVPVLISNDNVAPPIIGKPCSCRDIEQHTSLLITDEAELSLKAFAGPMTGKMAHQFYRALKNPSSPKNSPFAPKEQDLISKIKFTDPEKGILRIARLLAEDMGVDWHEYFPALNVFLNFATKEGLNVLETYFKHQCKEPLLSIIALEPAEQSLALVREYPSHMNPLKHRVNVLYSLLNSIKKEENFLTPPTSPEFVTPPSSPRGSPIQESNVFLKGYTFSKVDVDVLLTIQDCDFNPEEYPNVHKWKVLTSSEMQKQSSCYRPSQKRDLTPLRSRLQVCNVSRKLF